MTDQPDPHSQQARDEALASVTVALAGLCPMCRLRVLSNALAYEAIEATWPNAPLPLLNEVSTAIGQFAAMHFQMHLAHERADCAGEA